MNILNECILTAKQQRKNVRCEALYQGRKLFSRLSPICKGNCLVFEDTLIENELGELVVSLTISPKNCYDFCNVEITVADEEVTVSAQTLIDRYAVDVAGAYSCIGLAEFAAKTANCALTFTEICVIIIHYSSEDVAIHNAALDKMS